MTQYIDKSALVAEIEKVIDEIYAGRPFDSLSSEEQTALWYVKSIMSSIYFLEVKEVDLEKEVNAYMVDEMKFLSDEVGYDTLSTIAKHFFELGLKAQKRE